MNKLYLIFFLLPLYIPEGYAEKYYSGPAGNWCTEPNGQGKCTDSPKDQDELIIDRKITLKGPIAPKAKVKIVPGGEFTISDGQTGNMDVLDELEVEKGGMLVVQKDLSFRNNSKVDLDEGGTVLVKGNFKNFNNSDDVKIDGNLEVGGNFENGNNGKIQGNGKISVAGSCVNNGEVFNGTNTCAGIRNLTLPVGLVFFEGKVSDNSVQLSWATAYEENFDFFTVEKSRNANKGFIQVGEPVQGAGNSIEIVNYQFIDENPYMGRSYYRLKATDFDGTVEHHPIITINFQEKTDIRIYPNPNKGNILNIDINGHEEHNSLLKIYNIIGEEVFRANLNAGNNEYIFEKPLSKGLYIVIVENGSFKKQMKMTVQ